MTPGPVTPDDPFGLVGQPPLEVAGRRTAELFGARVEILSLPWRGQRHGMPGARQRAFQTNRADAILAAEAVWHAPGMALTGNAYPFAARQLLLWATERRREPSLQMLEVAFAIEDAVSGTTIANSMGAAASITRSHLHLLGETGGFIGDLPRSTVDPGLYHLTAEQVEGCTVSHLDQPFPVLAVGVSGPAPARARAVHHLLECRTTPSFNLIGTEQTAWLVPRSLIEIPSPYFPNALGGAELWGRWCCATHDLFERLTTADMEQALRIGGLPR